MIQLKKNDKWDEMRERIYARVRIHKHFAFINESKALKKWKHSKSYIELPANVIQALYGRQ